MTIQEKHRLIVDAWRFWQKYSEPQAGSNWMDIMLDEADQLCRRHNSTQQSRKLITAILRIIEEEHKGEK